MRFLLKAELPVESGNKLIKNGKLSEILQTIMEDLKPEAVYFAASNGKRSALVIFDMEDASQMPAVAEPWFLAFNASVEVTPVMLMEDLQKAGPAIDLAIEKYG